jgi:GH35 family endo-1,4-beta-xylanase
MRFLLLACAMALMCTLPVARASAAGLPPALAKAQPVPVLSADLSRFEFRDEINPTGARGSVSLAGEREGQPVFRARNPKGSSNYGGISVQWRTGQPIRKGDVLYGRFTLRSLAARQESGESEGLFFFQKRGGERAAQAFSIGSEWTTVGFPFVAADDIPAGEGLLAFSFGNLEQTFEITGLELLDFGQRLALADLPVTRFTYAGREPGAAWRRQALARIDEIRTAPLTMKVIDARGKPVQGARVEAVLSRPAFLWGSEVAVESILGPGPDGERYRKAVDELFDTVVIGNGLKWGNWRKPGGREQALATLDWLAAHGKRIKGHNLSWPAWKFTPRDIAADPAARAGIAGLVEAHIRDITVATKGRLIGWDVINEPVHETDYFQHMPRERVAEWFRMVKAGEPSLQLTLNEYAMLNRSSSPLFISEFKAFAEMLRKNGAPVDVLGVQGHVGQTPRAPVAVLSDLDLLAEGGNQVQITEYDFNTPDEALQADYNRDFLIAVYSHPAVSGFIQWGFWQGQHWKPDAAMIRRDWSEKPSMGAWRELVLGQWKTRIERDTDAAGEVAGKGHLGTYRVAVAYRGKTVTREAELAKGGNTVVVTVE